MDAPPLEERGFVYTFYSFKGGVGRSMALANVAALLSKWGKKVLIVDWDLEAPGIETYFGRWLEGSRKRTPGLLELIASTKDSDPLDWTTCLLQARIPQGESISILHAGLDDVDYSNRLRAIDWDSMFAQHGFGLALERLRDQWIETYDFVLVDSRTGITDIGGICTIHLPDVVISLFTTNEQSLVGVKEVMLRARRNHAQLPLQRKRLIVVPTPARDESSSEFQLAAQWRSRFAAELEDFYADWIPKDETSLRALDLLKIPYLAYWSFGERLPVMEEDIQNPKTLSYSYQLLARLILSRLDLRELLGGRQAAEALATQQSAAEQRVREAEAARARALNEEHARAEKHERQRAEEVFRFLDATWRPTIRRRQLAGYTTLVLGCAFLLAALGGMANMSWGRFVVLFDNPVQFAYAPWLQIGLAIGQVNLVIWAGAVTYASVGAWLGYWGWKRLRACAAAARERMLFDERWLGYQDLSTDQGLRLLLLHTRELLGNQFGELGRDHDRSPAPATPSSAAEVAPHPSAPLDPKQTSARSGTPALPAAESTGAVADPAPGQPVDIYVSYRRSNITRQWLQEFLPLFSAWLSESLGRDAVVFVDMAEVPVNSDWKRQLTSTAANSRCFLALLTTAYFSNEFTRGEWDVTFSSRARSIVPIWFQGEVTAFPLPVQSLQLNDFRDFAYVGEGFTRSEKYVEFQVRVHRLADEVARRIADSPSAL